MRVASIAIAMARIMVPSARVERHAVHDVVMIAGWIEDQRRGLRLTDAVGGARHDGMLPDRPWREGEGEGAESEAAEILFESRGAPDHAAIGRYFHRADAVAAVPRDACDHHRCARLNRR